MDRRDPADARNIVIDLVTRHIPRKFGLDPIRDVQVLTPMNRGPIGTIVLNEALQAALNPTGPGLVRGKVTFRIGDKVMQLRNDYDRNVYNGDVGVVSAIDEEEDTLAVRFDVGADARDVAYEGRALDELTLAYACTVHKSQGSEYPAIVMPLLTSHFVMLSKNLVYTAVTRGKRLVVLVADPRALRLALDDGKQDGRRSEQRQTKLALRIRRAEVAACGNGGASRLQVRRMLKRLIVGLFLGAVVGAIMAAVLVQGLGVLSFDASSFGAAGAYLAAAITGVLTGLVAGKPIWSADGKIEAGLKAFFGALLALGGMFILRQWVHVSVDLTALRASAGPAELGQLPAASLPIVAAVLAGFFELDNSGDEKEKKDTPKGATKASGRKVRVADEDNAEDEPEEKEEAAPAKNRR